MNADPFYILAVDGGGIRGVFPAHILKCIQTRLNVSLLDKFGMIAGTSTGSIVAAAVALDISLEKVIDLYRDHGSAIFKRRMFWGPSRFEPAMRSRYEKDTLRTVLNEVLGEITLGQISIPLLLPATDIGNGGVHVFKSSYSRDFIRDSSVALKDAVLASCSAPTYFDPTTVNEYLLADGGLWANNPSLAAVIDAQKRLGIKLEDVRILSIGTGHSRTCYGVNSGRKWGFVNGWKGPEFIDFLMSLQAQSTHNYLQLLLNDSQFIRLNFESDCPLPLDDCSAISDLISNADRVFTHNSQRISTFLGV
jgi:hypothetical protein